MNLTAYTVDGATVGPTGDQHRTVHPAPGRVPPGRHRPDRRSPVPEGTRG